MGERLLFLDLDSILDRPESEELAILRQKFQPVSSGKAFSHGLGLLTGRSIESARKRYLELNLPEPRVWLTCAGTEIYYSSENQSDSFWQSCIGADWDRQAVEDSLSDLNAHLVLQELDNQAQFKVSYLLKEPGDLILPLVRKRLRMKGQAARPHLRCHWFLDVVPLRASRTEAIRYLALRWGLPLESLLVVASQQGDAELMKGLTSAVVPAEHDPCLEGLKSSHQRVFFSSRSQVGGVIEGLNHYRFLSNH